jgi:hypothetical protein
MVCLVCCLGAIDGVARFVGIIVEQAAVYVVDFIVPTRTNPFMVPE